jgi:hypothetical protein
MFQRIAGHGTREGTMMAHPAVLRLGLGVTILLLALAGRPVAAQEWLYTVRPGDTLWHLSEVYLRRAEDWRRLQALNGVADPQNLPPGMRLRIPIAWMKVQPVPARLIAVHGRAEVVRFGSTVAESVGVTTALTAGDSLAVGADSSATVEFADGSRMLLGAESAIVLDSLSVSHGAAFIDTRVRLINGRSEVGARPSEGGVIRFEITTPAAVSAVRGTDFRVGIQDAGESARTEVLTGAVAVTGRARTLQVPGGFGTVVRAGAPPGAPRPLLPPPDLSALPAILDRIPFALEVPAVAGAAGYRWQLAADPSFAPVLFDRATTTNRVTGLSFAEGSYVIRVRAIDALGLEGADGTAGIVVDARPEPPLLIDPPPDGFIPDGKPGFRWSEPEDAGSYRLQIARGEDFARPVADIADLGAARYSPDSPLDAGEYRWRVATVDRRGDQGPFSDPQHFRVPLPGPAPAAPESKDDTLIFRWSGGAEGERFRFQMARDRDFDDRIADLIVAQPRADIPRPAGGRYYIRVARIEPSGEEGAFGVTQKIFVETDLYWLLLLPVIGVLLTLI